MLLYKQSILLFFSDFFECVEMSERTDYNTLYDLLPGNWCMRVWYFESCAETYSQSVVYSWKPFWLKQTYIHHVYQDTVQLAFLLQSSIHIKSPVVKRVIKAISFDNSNGRQCAYAHLSWCYLVHCSIEASSIFKSWINSSVHEPNIWRWQILEHASASCCGFVETGSGCLP